MPRWRSNPRPTAESEIAVIHSWKTYSARSASAGSITVARNAGGAWIAKGLDRTVGPAMVNVNS